MPRLRLYDVRLSRLYTAVGICQGDVVGTAEIVNAAQLRLITAAESGDTGWWGSWARMVFNLTPESDDTYTLTLPRQVARLTDLTVCKHPVRIQNEFFEFLEFGVGKQPTRPSRHEMYDRGTFPTFVDIPANCFVRTYISSGTDGGQRALVQGLDTNGDIIYSQDGYNEVEGIFVSFAQPFSDVPQVMTKLTGIQKDVTSGTVQYHAVDQTTGTETPLLTMDPGEMVSGYRRYMVTGLPGSCCYQTGTTSPVQMEAMAKLELIPVVVDTDYLLIQNLEAVIAECKAVRYGDIDSMGAKQMAATHHKEAIRLLQGQLIHYLGKQYPAINFAPFGSAKLEKQRIGVLR